jgi:hypothetical protein
VADMNTKSTADRERMAKILIDIGAVGARPRSRSRSRRARRVRCTLT